MDNIIAIPTIYRDTSLDEIFASIKIAASKISLQYHIIGCDQIFDNKLPANALDDSEFELGQLKIIEAFISKVQTGGKVLFLDFFMPGLDIIKYHLEREEMQVKMGALLHGGSFVRGDLLNKLSWLPSIEQAHFDIFDIIYSPSEFLKNLVPSSFSHKTITFPWGLDAFTPVLSGSDRQFDVIFPHRFATDKGIDDFFTLTKYLPNVNFLVTSPSADRIDESFAWNHNVIFLNSVERSRHHELLSSAKIVLSVSIQENFGYSVYKAVLSGCIPVLPNGLCYREMYNNEYLYNNLEEAAKMIENKLRNYQLIDSGDALLQPVAPSFTELLNNFFNE